MFHDGREGGGMMERTLWPDAHRAIANPGGTANYGGYAYFPGTGPETKTCASCGHRLIIKKTVKNETSGCRKWIELTNHRGPLEKVAPIYYGAPACKYYEEKT